MTPTVSVFTATHNPRHLLDAYESLLAQGYTDWEWIVLLNGGGRIPSWNEKMRVFTAPASQRTDAVGHWKREAVERCSGRILVELDHDDMLAPEALQQIVDAFEANPEASMVYSDTVQVTVDGQPDDERFDPAHGWSYYDVPSHELGPGVAEHAMYSAVHALPPTPHNVSLIWYAPNHVRAFTRDAYDRAGGYDRTLVVCDDQDLMCRLFQVGAFVQLAEPLYLQRTHDGMTQRGAETNARIQTTTWDLYEQHLQGNLLAWAQREQLLAVEIGCGHAKTPGYLGVDRVRLPGVDIVAELPDLSVFSDGSVGVIRAVDVLEHVADQQALMAEIHRVLAPHGMLLSLTPSTDGRGAFQDPTHVSFWNANSFWYWTDARMQHASPQHAGTARFQVSRLRTYHPSDWHTEHDISYVQANLIKPGAGRDGGLLSQ